MPALFKELLSTLDTQGFSHDALKLLAEKCHEFTNQSDAFMDESDNVMCHIIGDFCFWTADRMDALQPITADNHSRIEAIVLPRLQSALAGLGEQISCEEKMTLIAELMAAEHELRQGEIGG